MGSMISTKYNAFRKEAAGLDEKQQQQNECFFPLNNKPTRLLMQEYDLKMEWIHELKILFERLDSNCDGFISMEDFRLLSRSHIVSSSTIYSDFLFNLAMKEDTTQMDFIEFVRCVVNFCILNYEGILMFVFRIIDADNDELISLKDVYDFVCSKIDSKLVFPVNAMRKVELIEVMHNELTFTMFMGIAENFDFVLFPALLLQEDIKRNVIGFEFWKS
jgi:Ca2+-binding EF-hand superfamily protein